MDTTIYYYVYKNEQGHVYGWLASDKPTPAKNAVPVSKEEFIELGGNPDNVVTHKSDTDKEIDLLKAQVQAVSNYEDFLEECIVEMAMAVYD